MGFWPGSLCHWMQSLHPSTRSPWHQRQCGLSMLLSPQTLPALLFWSWGPPHERLEGSLGELSNKIFLVKNVNVKATQQSHTDWSISHLCCDTVATLTYPHKYSLISWIRRCCGWTCKYTLSLLPTSSCPVQSHWLRWRFSPLSAHSAASFGLAQCLEYFCPVAIAHWVCLERSHLACRWVWMLRPQIHLPTQGRVWCLERQPDALK